MMNNDNKSSNRIGCAMRLWDSPQLITVVNDGRFSEEKKFSEEAPPGVDITCTEHFPLHNHAVFYLHNPGRGPQGVRHSTRYDHAFELWTQDGYKLAFNKAKGGPNTAECPIHTDATTIHWNEVLVFTKLLGRGQAPVPVSAVPETAVPYTIQTGAGYFLQSIPSRSEHNQQPIYKSLEAEEEAYRVQFVELPEKDQQDWDKEFAHIRAELKNKELESTRKEARKGASGFCCFCPSRK